ncbi:hypothetical protein [Lacinutrix sp. 5H-3-7-4]|uniref:hypothetical protein n=1 Tax=Lacinutrix sp. (strain 5H-3-7-4) TaxID=983544 RepID=UPI00020A344B|nr:hypothetical protein [Lacinutrix sp. 5H-3-7-4]AEH02620.1 hypothetical protein Lacal_2781 [Lacinutrix sp. 5H-3-7-4]
MKIKDENIKQIAKESFKNVFRTTTSAPGFIHLIFNKKQLTPFQFRSIMVDLKKELSSLSLSKFNKKLSYHWLVRFDQQVNTPFHVDNAGDQSILMLGYEPSTVDSELHIADYHTYANKAFNSPKDYYKMFSPIFKGEDKLLVPFTSKINSNNKGNYAIVILNNSNPKSSLETLGVFHKAKILKKDLTKSRVVNSMVLNLVSKNKITEDKTNETNFLKNTVISK